MMQHATPPSSHRPVIAAAAKDADCGIIVVDTVHRFTKQEVNHTSNEVTQVVGYTRNTVLRCEAWLNGGTTHK